jgi:hypothetical protein
MITLVKDNGKWDRGRKAIMVDGVRWGTVEMVGHGCHGPSYSIIQSDGEGTGVDCVAERIRAPRKRWDQPKIPVERVLIPEIERLISSEKLLHPDVLRERADLAAKKWREQRKLERAKEIAAIRLKVRKATCRVIGGLLSGDLLDRLVAEIAGEFHS